ncbi:MAG: multicopper oxidase family protein [Thermodesulfobacteriota bacterium]
MTRRSKNSILFVFLLIFTPLIITCDEESKKLIETFFNPPEISSTNGVLNTTFTLEFADGEITEGDNVLDVFNSRMINGTYTPPVLRVNQGDLLKITLQNNIDQMYQNHTHGANVSPISPGDDIFTMIMPTGFFNYEIPIPENHPQGLFYYHSHTFKLGEFQVMSGMSGGLIVEGILDPFPDLQGIDEKIMYLKDIQIDENGEVPMDIDSNDPTNRLVNGMVNPVLFCNPGETQFWRILNIGADIYYNLELQDHTLFIIGRDGNRTTEIVPINSVERPIDFELLGISSRWDALVQCGEPGEYKLKTNSIFMGDQGDTYPEKTLLTLVVQGDEVEQLDLPSMFPEVENLCDIEPVVEREFVFSENDMNQFFINGEMFDPKVINTVVEVGTVERWTVKNNSMENHQFHIHQTDFVVCSINGEDQPFTGRQDTVNLPFKVNEEDPDTEVVIAIDFRDPVICGNFVYHCHIMNHEDNGMMARIKADGALCPEIPPVTD